MISKKNEKPKLRLVLMGTPDFGVPAFRDLAGQDYPIAAVVSQPDKPKGRGHKEAFSAVKQFALELGLPLLQPENVNAPDFLQKLRELAADVIVVAAFGQILKSELLNLPPLGCINLHGSLLPKYRGAAPIQWAIARGETETGLTVQRMAERVDSGPILTQHSLAIGADETYLQLYRRLSAAGAAVVAPALEILAAQGLAAGQAQDETLATLAPRLKREDGLISWNETGEQIHNRVRAFNPWPGTYTYARGERLKLIETHRSAKTIPVNVPAGSILEIVKNNGWLVAAGNGTTVQVRRVQCDNAHEMTAQAFTCGYRLGMGSVLGLEGE